MQIVGEYDKTTVHGNGCLGAEVPGKMYIDSGGGTAANLHQADLYAFPTDGYSSRTRRTRRRPSWSSAIRRRAPTRMARR